MERYNSRGKETRLSLTSAMYFWEHLLSRTGKGCSNCQKREVTTVCWWSIQIWNDRRELNNLEILDSGREGKEAIMNGQGEAVWGRLSGGKAGTRQF